MISPFVGPPLASSLPRHASLAIAACSRRERAGSSSTPLPTISSSPYLPNLCQAGWHCSPVDEGIVPAGHLWRLRIGVRILREVRGVTRAAHLRNEGRRQSLLPKLEPVEVLEPAMIFDVVGTVAEASVTLGHIRHQQVLHQTLGIPK